MSDLTVTAANVKSAGGNTTGGTAGATITAGQPVYLDSATGKYKLSDNNAAGAKTVSGIALNGASDGQPIDVLTGGDITIGATMTAGLSYWLSATAGGIAPYADLASGNDVVLIGVSKSTTVLHVMPFASGVTL